MADQKKDTNDAKFGRLFEQIDELKTRVTKVEVYEEVEKEKLQDIIRKLDEMSVTLNQIIGKETARAGIYGVVGSVVSGVIVWIISLIRNAQ